MAAPLAPKETRALLASLAEQGSVIAKTKKGVKVTFPNGSATVLHWTNSDSRSTLNVRARVRRAGLVWPFDHQQRGKTMGVRLSEERQQTLNQTIEALPEGSTTSIAKIARQAGVSEPTARKNALGHGLIQEARSVWRVPTPEVAVESSDIEVIQQDIEYPEIARARAEVAPVPEVTPTLGREFIDSADSWIISTPADLAAMAAQMGLNIEVRVWR